MQIDKVDLTTYINKKLTAQGKQFRLDYTERIVDIVESYLILKTQASDEDVEYIYKTYPRKKEPKAAKRAIKKACNEKGTEFIKDRVEIYVECVNGWTDEEKQYIPYPASWFNKGCYDEPESEWLTKGIIKSSSPSMSLYQINNRLREIGIEIQDLRFPGGCPNPVEMTVVRRKQYNDLKKERSCMIRDKEWHLEQQADKS